MSDFWTDIDHDILDCLAHEDGPVTPDHLAQKVGMSKESVCSILSMLASQGRIRICEVAARDDSRHRSGGAAPDATTD